MKKIFFLLTLFTLFLMQPVNASHMMGGQITIKPISGLDYLVTYTAYRDMTGIQISVVADLKVTDSLTNTTFNVSIPYSNVSVLVPLVEEYIYVGTITFPHPGNWTISYEECCRNSALLNMNPNCHYFYTNIMVDSLNSSPQFLNPPIVVAQENVPFFYNPLPYDADGDSIAWSLDIPLDCSNVPSTNYTLPPSDTLLPFSLNNITGEVSFLPKLIGNFQVSVRVHEYRNGVEIGTISRDMQIIVVPSINSPAAAILNTNIPSGGNKIYNLSPGANATMTVNVYDPDLQAITITAAGEPFGLAVNPAQYTINNGTSSASFSFNWTPLPSQARQAPYLVSFRTEEFYAPYYFQSDLTLALRVGNFTGIEIAEERKIMELIPNPATEMVNCQFLSEATGEVALNILSIDGKLLKSERIKLNAPGLQVIKLNVQDLAKGVYIVTLLRSGESIGVDRLIRN